MYYIIYKTTNLINNKIYIGYHSTKDLNDSYLGSGMRLKQAIEKYGESNFKRDILYVFPTREEALLKEEEIVDEAFVYSQSNYNMKVGGEGGWDHTHKDPMIRQKKLDAIKESFKNGTSKGWQLTDEQRSEIGKKSFLGKTHSPETRKKIGEAKKMDAKTINERIEDFRLIEKKYGYISRLAEKWDISHTPLNKLKT